MDTTSLLVSSPTVDAEDASTIGRKSARRRRIEFITRGERRRVWTLEQKREIVMESLGPELTPTEVARKHAISSGMLYTWRQQILGGGMSRLACSTPSFAQVEITSAPVLAEVSEARPTTPPGPPEALVPVRSKGLIEIVLSGGVTLRVDAAVDGAALCRVLNAVAGR